MSLTSTGQLRTDQDNVVCNLSAFYSNIGNPHLLLFFLTGLNFVLPSTRSADCDGTLACFIDVISVKFYYWPLFSASNFKNPRPAETT